VPGHVLGDRGLAYIDPEFEKLSVDAGSAPERISQTDLSDQSPDVERYI
jgi:hypothetical protein